MNIQQVIRWKTVAACIVLGLAVTSAFAPVTAQAAPSCDPATDKQCVDVCGAASKCNNFINEYINPLVKVLTALVGIAAVISIIMAGIQYSSSADDPGTVTKAKQRIFNVVLGLVAYVFLIAFLQYLVPGGIWR